MVTRFKSYILIALLCVAWAGMAHPVERLEHTTYALHTGQSFTFAWDRTDGATHYDVEGFIWEQKQAVRDSKWQGIKGNSLSITIPRGGHWIFKVRACGVKLVNGGEPVPVCSEWASIVDPKYAVVDNQPKTWWVYGYVAPPGGGGIE